MIYVFKTIAEDSYADHGMSNWICAIKTASSS